MSQQTMNFGATQVAEPPAPLIPESDVDGAGDNRRKLLLVGAGVGVLVLVLAAFFLLKGGGSSSSSSNGFVVPHHAVKPKPSAAAPAPVTLPKRVVTPVGRDPFKVLYAAPVAAAGGSTGSSSSSATTTSSTGTSSTTTTGAGTTTTTKAPSYRPVWIQLKSLSGSTATFTVGYSNGKTLRALSFTVTASRTHAVSFGGSFALEAIRNGVATLKFGDGSPFQLDRIHNTMVVG